jgi:hypothetical protein
VGLLFGNQALCLLIDSASILAAAPALWLRAALHLLLLAAGAAAEQSLQLLCDVMPALCAGTAWLPLLDVQLACKEAPGRQKAIMSSHQLMSTPACCHQC